MTKPYEYLDSKIGRIKGDISTNNLFWLGAITFLTLMFLGALLSDYLFYPFAKALMLIIGSMDWMVEVTGSSDLTQAALIFGKNFLAITACALLARRTRGISLVLILLVNGLMIGALLQGIEASGMYKFLGVMTHGVFEFTALFLGVAYGIQLLLLPERKHAAIIRKIFYVIFPLLVVAAAVEVYVTPLVINKIG